MNLVKGSSGIPALIDTIKKVENLLSQVNSKEALDILHLLRIKHAKELRKLSDKTRDAHDERIRSNRVSERAGTYLIVIVNPEGNVILYAGKTSGKSNTSGLEFRIRDHIRLLGKTPLTLFIPNWWVKRIYTMAIEDKDKAKSLEERLWMFSYEKAKGKSRFNSLQELDKELFKIIEEYIESSNEIRTIELQPNLNPKSYFLLKTPPAGRPRGLPIGDEYC